MREWAGKNFDPEKFSAKAVNLGFEVQWNGKPVQAALKS